MSKFCLFSSVEAQVISRGAPLAGVRVIQNYSSAWFDRENTITRAVLTDADGKFVFAPIFAKNGWSSFLALWLPHEPDIRQNITIEYNNKLYEAYTASKYSYDLDAELLGVPMRFIIDLDSPPSNK